MTTNAKAIKSTVGVSLLIENDDLEKVATDFDIVLTDQYVKGNLQKINAAAASLLYALYQLSSVSEGGFSVSFNKELVEKRIYFLSSNSGGLFPIPPDLEPKRRVRSINAW